MNTMTRSLVPALAGALLIACSGTGGGRTMDLHIEGAGGSMAYFDRFENNRPIRVDSVKLNDAGEGTIRVPAMPLDFYRIAVGQEQIIVALDSAESLTIEAKMGALNVPTTISGSPHTDALYEFYAKSTAFDEERERLRAAISGSSDTALIGKFNAMNARFYEECKAFVQAHESSPVALTALGKLNMQQELPLFKQVRESLRKTMPRSGFFAMFRDQVDRLEQQEIAIKMQEEEQKRLSNLLPIGTEAPEIRQQTPDGKTLALSELRGKVVLIDFWASWCRPCRIENPNVKKVYNKYASKGFEILGVSLDRDHASWVKAIKDDGLPWKQVSDLGFWNNAAAQEYGVSSIPFTVLIDREGRIIEKGLRGDELDGRLKELFGS